MHVTKPSKDTTHSESTESVYMTTITSKHISMSSTPPSGLLKGASVHETKLPDYLLPLMAGVTAVAVTLCIIIFFLSLKKKKLFKQCCVKNAADEIHSLPELERMLGVKDKEELHVDTPVPKDEDRQAKVKLQHKKKQNIKMFVWKSG